MELIITFTVGLMLGGCTATILVCALVAGKRADEYMEWRDGTDDA